MGILLCFVVLVAGCQTVPPPPRGDTNPTTRGVSTEADASPADTTVVLNALAIIGVLGLIFFFAIQTDSNTSHNPFMGQFGP